MIEALKQQILGLAGPARLSPELEQGLVAEWDHYFEAVGLPEAQQPGEFNSIMRGRVQAGIISVRAPTRILD